MYLLDHSEVPIDFDRKASGQGADAKRCSAVASRIAKNVDQKIGRPIDYRGVFSEVFGRVDEAANTQAGGDAVQVAVQGHAQLRDHVDRA